MKEHSPARSLAPNELRWEVDESLLDFASTDELEPIAGTIAQERAIDALRMGIENNAPGFNVFVSGITGTGRSMTVKSLLRVIQPRCRIAPDRAYVHNFENGDRPRLLTFPRGRAVAFASEMKQLSKQLVESVPRIFESPHFEQERKAIVEKYSQADRARFQALDRSLTEKGLALATMTIGEVTRPDIVVRRGDQGIPIGALQNLVDAKEMDADEASRLTAAHAESLAELEGMLKEARQSMRQMATEMDALVQTLGAHVIDGAIADLKERFQGRDVHEHLDCVRRFVLDSLALFHAQQQPGAGDGGPGEMSPSQSDDALPVQLAVNVILDNSNLEECPMIMEPRPSYRNLFGVIERVSDRFGAWHTDFTKIRAGSLLRADGGVLLLNAQDVLEDPFVWHSLKIVLRFRQLEIQNPVSVMTMGAEALMPEPIPVDVKVVLIGDYGTYQALCAYDPAFEKTFKVLAHFDSEMAATSENIHQMARLVASICRNENLLPVARSGFASLLEYAVRASGRRDKLPTRFGDIADRLREADYYARRELRTTIDGSMFERAVAAQKTRHSLIEEKLQDSITTEMIMISTSGKVVGQINGLAVYDMRTYRFGKPSRVTVSTGVGGAGLINIERESGLSGQTHDKGVLILTGYLRRTFAQEAPLALSASIAFEQSYGTIDGDSASSTELYALLSDLAQTPIDQGLAVTGSVNQQGEVQAIGGVNEKIEAFFELCNDRGLTGTQGVLIPYQNVADLQLDARVVAAVASGTFHIHAVRHVDQGIELLTGVDRDEIHHRVRARLQAFREALQGRPANGGERRLERSPDDVPGSPPPPPPPSPPSGPPPPPHDPGEPR